MRAKDLRLKAPVIWDAVKQGVYQDLRIQKKIHKFEMTNAAAEAISHNAAFIAVSKIHSLLIGKRVYYGRTEKNEQA